MEVKVSKEPISDYQDVHGGACTEITANITIDSNLTSRVKRNLVIHEVVEAYNPSLSHDKVGELTDLLSDALDQLEG